MANGTHRKVAIKPNDCIVFSSNPIPGNEKSVTGIINELMMKGADVIFQDVHVSGHDCQEDIKLIYQLVNPKYSIPVHGEYKHLVAQAKIAEELGYDTEHIKLLSSGDVLEIDENGAEVTGIACGKVVGFYVAPNHQCSSSVGQCALNLAESIIAVVVFHQIHSALVCR